MPTSGRRAADRRASTTVGPTTAGPPPSTDERATLDWRRCDDGFQCATLQVPLDYSRPKGEQIGLALVRRQAKKPAQRIGALLVNPGGPGASAVEFAEQLPLPRELRDRFDIVGFDPRGVGRSTPLDCHRNLQAMYDADPTMEDQADRDRYLAETRTYVEGCRAKYARVLPFLGTRSVARDMDRVRAAVGDAKLSYVGFSYGSSLGEEYAALFPTNVRAMVLDGVVDNGQPGLRAADLQAAGFEKALQAFLDDCARQSGCPLGPNPGPVLDQVIGAAERRPIPAAGHDRPATPGVIQLAIGRALYSRELWPDLARALKEGADGNGNDLVALADDYLQRMPDGQYPNLFEIYFAVSCLDSAWPKDPQAIFSAAKATGRTYRRLGEGLVNDYVRCALWPTPSQPLEAGTAPGSPPILVISTTGDPATPYQSGVDVAKRLAKGVLLTNVGEGHTVFTAGKACVDDAVTTYLVTLRPPPNGLRCG